MARSVSAEHPVSREVRDVSGAGDAGKRQPYFNDVAIIAWVVALIGIVALAAAVVVLGLISATAPASPRTAGPTLDGRAVTGVGAAEPVSVEDDWIYGPTLTR